MLKFQRCQTCPIGDGGDDGLAGLDEGAQVGARVFRVGLRGQNVVAESEHGIGTMLRTAEKLRAFGEAGDLVLMGEEQSAVLHWWLQPGMRFMQSDVLCADAPAGFRALRLASQGLCDHLVTKANAHGLPRIGVQGADKILQVLYPFLVFED